MHLNSFRFRLCGRKTETLDQIVDRVGALRDEGEGHDLSLREEHQSGLMHGEFFAQRFGEIRTDQMLRTYFGFRYIALKLETLRGGDFGEWREIVLRLFQSGIGRGFFRGDGEFDSVRGAE